MMPITKTSVRTDLFLRICEALDGAVTADVLYAALPRMHESAVRRLLLGLTSEGVLFPACLMGTHVKVWLDAAGRRRWLRRDPDGSLSLRVVPGRTFTHDRMAALLVAGLGHEYGMYFDREVPVNKGDRKPDGYAWIGENYVLVVEVERMRGRNVHVWDDERRNGVIKPGLLTGMLEILRGQQRQEAGIPIRESLVCLPARFIAKLEAQLAPRVQQLGPKQCGWWSVSMEDPDAELVWHPIRGDRRPNLPGLRTIRNRTRPPKRSTPPPSRGFLRRDLQTILDRAKAAQNGGP